MTSRAAPSAWSVRDLPLHPTLLAAAIIIGFWVDTTVSPVAAMRPLAIGVLAAAGLTVAAGLVLRNRHLAGLLVTAVILVLYSKRLIALAEELGGLMPAWLVGVWLALIGVALLLVGRIAWRLARRWSLAEATAPLNLAATLLLVATLGSGLLGGGIVAAVTADGSIGRSVTPATTTAASAEGPDMYVVLLDGYPRADVLAHAFGHDNSAFVDALEQRGFTVATRSHSDYLWTHVMLPSTLHMSYIENVGVLQPVVEGEAPLHPTVRGAVNRNPVFQFVRERGYEVVTTASGYEEVALRGADAYLDGGQMNEFELRLLSSTFLGDIANAIAPDLASSSQRHRIAGGLAALVETAGRDDATPRFVFAHIPAPHQPMVFGRDGAPRAVRMDEHFYADSPIEQGIEIEGWMADYRDQLEYLNELVLETVDGIMAASPEPPVIVLWADHGSASRVDWTETTPSEADEADLLERTGTLFAALTPGQSGVFADDIAPVNLFRSLFDAYFETDFGPAPLPEDGGQIPPVDASVLDR